LWYFRWDITATKSNNYAVLKWSTDRWTGQQWLIVYRVNDITERPLPIWSNNNEKIDQKIVAERDKCTLWWQISTGVTSLWFLIALAISLKNPSGITQPNKKPPQRRFE